MRIQLTSSLPDHWLEEQAGSNIDRRYARRIITGEPCDVMKPDGAPLLIYRPAVLPIDLCEECRPALRKVGMTKGENRDYHSGLFGYYTRPVCRKTAFSLQHLDHYGQCLRFARAVDSIFAREMPEAHARQRRHVRDASRWSLHGTAFSTGTANLWTPKHDARTPLHIDKGDLREGFGVISVLRRGSYTGGELMFPKYGIAVDLQHGDVLLADVHEYHANAPIVGEEYERISVILYFLEDLSLCPKQV